MIEIQHLNFGYKRQEPLFRDTNLTLTPGNIYGLLGENGAGKSSLLRLASGLLYPDSGSINALNCDPAKRNPDFLSNIFVLPEEINTPNVSDSEYIRVRAPFYPNFDLEAMENYLREFEVPRGRKLARLSYGQKKKFLISFGLACNARLIMLDEPTNGLDIPSKGTFRRLVASALNEEQIMLLSTHQVADIESLVDCIVVLHGGKVLMNISTALIAENLRISLSSRPPEEGGACLYSEPVIGGYAALWQDTNGGEGMVDLELLFKAVVTNPDTFNSIFNRNSEEDWASTMLLMEVLDDE